MVFKTFNIKVTALAFSLLALAAHSEISASDDCSHHSHHCHSDRHHDAGVIAAQANYQDENALSPVVGQPISFSARNFRTNVEVNSNRSVFEVEVPGLYSIDSFLLLNVPNIGDTVAGYITINGRELLTFYNSETRTALSPIVNFHFNDRLVYLQKGDRVSVVLSEFTPGTTILSRGFVLVALNNSR